MSTEPFLPKIYAIRSEAVILDCDSALPYGVEVGQFNQAMKSMRPDFRHDFVFQLTKDDWDSL